LGRVEGVVLVNLLFGLCHAITPLYVVLASAVGFYLSWLLDALGERNLLVPVVTHGLYDYWAFLVVVRTWRKTEVAPSEPCP
jgi:membrane protease YdiL (CAAX protease family)